jgi:hypothetical protein
MMVRRITGRGLCSVETLHIMIGSFIRDSALAKQSLCTPYSVRSNRAGVHTCVLFVFGGLAGL